MKERLPECPECGEKGVFVYTVGNLAVCYCANRACSHIRYFAEKKAKNGREDEV